MVPLGKDTHTDTTWSAASSLATAGASMSCVASPFFITATRLWYRNPSGFCTAVLFHAVSWSVRRRVSVVIMHFDESLVTSAGMRSTMFGITAPAMVLSAPM